ncbi:hypothetical protein [Gynuella sunshinyii]|uniref:Uncharacterized protein n=1 Tax=Gynuella sunshinyii YC6258 TaxID=1445510 RepID=A0A0C5VWM3_9GAMM|nr:hypothetical protein [Gynuella sunshinyii]AJQ97698.1 hypothetical Protein YC6258_05669 [Gynuella sunshinyii YC6258]
MALGIAFLTGQPHLDSCSLSQDQQQFAQQLIRRGVHLEPLNFPYREGMKPYRQQSPVATALTLSWQYLRSRTQQFSDNYSACLRDLINKHPRTLFLAGHCGLEFLNNIELPESCHHRIHVLAYGPIARCRLNYPTMLVQGRRDWISKIFFSDTDFQIQCGVSDYLRSPELLQLARLKIDKLLQDIPTPAPQKPVSSIS